jgi:spore germination protein KB
MATFVYHLKDYLLAEAFYLFNLFEAFLIGVYAIHFGIEVIASLALIRVFSIIALNILLMMVPLGISI